MKTDEKTIADFAPELEQLLPHRCGPAEMPVGAAMLVAHVGSLPHKVAVADILRLKWIGEDGHAYMVELRRSLKAVDI